MKVYNRDAFMKLPAGTLYCKGKPWFWEALFVKGETWTNDWLYCDVAMIEVDNTDEMDSRLQEMLDLGASYPMADSFGRDGCFDKDDLFLVYERDDLLKLRGLIDFAAGAATPPAENTPAATSHLSHGDAS